MSRIIAATALFCLVVHGLGLAQGSGTLEGRVTDAQTQEPLPGVSVEIPSLRKGALSDENGRYVIREVPLGTHALKAEYPGYVSFVEFQVRLESGTTTFQIAMQPQVGAETEAVQITAGFFQRGNAELVSTRTIGAELIQSNPGGNQDISRALQSLPGVGGVPGFRNDLIIRGGAPNENVFYLDGIEVPNINHFATQGSGGGPTGIIPSYMIQSVKFQTSGFGARFDNAMSSVLDFELQTANSERFQNLLTISATEFGAAFDTPIGRKVRLTSSIRRSYLDLLAPAIGLPFLPEYTDIATKLVWEINPKTSLTYLHIGAWDNFKRNVPADADSLTTQFLDVLPSIQQRTFTQGLVLKRSTNNGVISLALSRNFLFNFFEQFAPLPVYSETNTVGPKRFDFDSFEADTRFRLWVTTVKGKWEFNYGATVQWSEFEADSWARLTFPVVLPDTAFTQSAEVRGRSDFNYFRYGAHGQVARAYFAGRLRTSFGLRVDMNSFTLTGNDPLRTLSPRGSASWALSPKFLLNASTGIYYKLPANIILGYAPDGKLVNRNAAYFRSTHFVLGGEYRPTESVVISLEAFLKVYDDYPVDARTGINLANTGGNFDLFGNTEVRSVGNGRAYGIEFMAQKMMTKRLYGILSATYFKSEFAGIDAATGKVSATYIRSAWDLTYLGTLTGGYRFGKSNSWEVSARVRMAGGTPYTPFNIEQSRAEYPSTGRGVLDFTRLNTEVTPSFFTLDFRLDKRWFFQKWSLNLFLDIQNATAAENLGAPEFFIRRGANGFITGPNNYALFTTATTNLLPSIGARVKWGYGGSRGNDNNTGS